MKTSAWILYILLALVMLTCAAACGVSSGGGSHHHQAIDDDASPDDDDDACNPESCPNGCCNGTACMGGTTSGECGANGAACVSCPSYQDCVSGACVCNAKSCPLGCCDASGVCQPGTAKADCGTGGAACVACPAGHDCVGRSCQCDAASCPNGCCDATGVCQAGNTNEACGTGGASCVPCTPGGNNCENGVCTTSIWIDPTSGLMWQNGSTVGENDSSWADARSYCAGLSWGAYSGWRLPTITELRSLVRNCQGVMTGGICGVADPSCLDASCAGECAGCSGVSGSCWPDPEITGHVDWYWSSSPVADSAGSDWWSVNFAFNGNCGVAVNNASGATTRCVREPTVACATSCPSGCCDATGICQPGTADAACGKSGVRCVDCTASASGQTCDAAASQTCGVWTDPQSGLMWQNGPTVGSNSFNQPGAATYCTNSLSSPWNHYTGWRLPDIDELRSLIRGCPATDSFSGATCPPATCCVTDSCAGDSTCYGDACLGCSYTAGPYWPLLEISGDPNDWYWSSTADPDMPGFAWCVRFEDAGISYAESVPGYFLARCVRSSAERERP